MTTRTQQLKMHRKKEEEEKTAAMCKTLQSVLENEINKR